MFIPFPKSPHNIPLYALIPFHETLRFNFFFGTFSPLSSFLVAQLLVGVDSTLVSG